MEQKTKQKRVHTAVLWSVAILAGVLAFFQFRRAEQYAYAQDLHYQQIFVEAAQYVEDLETTLLKAMLVNEPRQMVQVSGELYRQASAAKANLSQLPLGETQTENTNKFLSQVGEYANSLTMKLLDGGEVTAEELQTLESLSVYATRLKDGIEVMMQAFMNGTLDFEQTKHLFQNGTPMASGLEAVEKEFHDYPSLVYDGPFSKHIDDKASAFLESFPELSQEEALRVAKEIWPTATYVRDGNGKIPTYEFSAAVETGTVSFELTRRGGKLLWLLNTRATDAPALSVDEAKKVAQAFLEKMGYSSMKESYYERFGDAVLLNYAYQQGEYTVFPDLAKVKVALDTGEVIGFEGRGYLMNHSERQIPAPILSADEARGKLAASLSVSEVSMAVVPSESAGETFCYQFSGTVKDRNYLVYVNTQTGHTEEIMLLLESENGTLAI